MQELLPAFLPRFSLMARLSGEWVAVLIVTTILAAQAQEPAKPQSQNNNGLFLQWNDVEKNIWANAKPYLDDPLPQLEDAVPELKGLDPAAGQEKLAFILSKIGSRCVEQLQHTPNVISDEKVITRMQHSRPWQEKFGYLVLSRQTADGTVLEEYRTDSHGHAIQEGPGSGPFSQGFASMWVRFLPANRSESRFRYLGQQEVDKHKTLVVAFAQIPDSVKFPAEFLFQGTRISILYQGVAWIDPSDFRIMRMREDLLAPRPDAYLQKFTAQIRFNEVHIAKAASSLWLPQEALVEWDFEGRLGQQRHVYSHYRLYGVQTKVLPAE